MKANYRKVRKRRFFTEEFKKNLVEEFESGKFSVLELEKLHGINNGLIYRWIYKYSKTNKHGYRVIEMKDSSSNKIKELQAKIKELEQMVGRKQIEIDYLETMMEVAKEELDVDIKKNFGTPQSGRSKKGKKK